MILTLTRHIKHKNFTEGLLSIDGEPFCQTLEPTWRDIAFGQPARWVKGRTAVPDGHYPLAVTSSARHGGRWLPLLLTRDPRFRDTRIAEGHTLDGQGSDILVGILRPQTPGTVLDSHLWLHRLVRRLAARPLGEGVQLHVLQG